MLDSRGGRPLYVWCSCGEFSSTNPEFHKLDVPLTIAWVAKRANFRGLFHWLSRFRPTRSVFGGFAANTVVSRMYRATFSSVDLQCRPAPVQIRPIHSRRGESAEANSREQCLWDSCVLLPWSENCTLRTRSSAQFHLGEISGLRTSRNYPLRTRAFVRQIRQVEFNRKHKR